MTKLKSVVSIEINPLKLILTILHLVVYLSILPYVLEMARAIKLFTDELKAVNIHERNENYRHFLQQCPIGNIMVLISVEQMHKNVHCHRDCRQLTSMVDSIYK